MVRSFLCYLKNPFSFQIQSVELSSLSSLIAIIIWIFKLKSLLGASFDRKNIDAFLFWLLTRDLPREYKRQEFNQKSHYLASITRLQTKIFNSYYKKSYLECNNLECLNNLKSNIMPVAFVLPMKRYCLFQEWVAVTNQQHIHIGRNQKMLLIESVQDKNLNKEVSLHNLI